MVRLLAFVLHANSSPDFGRGLSSEDEPDLWLRDATGTIDLWIDVGLPDEREVRKACGRARQVVVLAYGKRRAEMWWNSSGASLTRLKNLSVLLLSGVDTAALRALAARSMNFACTIQDGHVWLASETATAEITPSVRLAAAAG